MQHNDKVHKCITKHNNDLTFTNVTAVRIGRLFNKFRGLLLLLQPTVQLVLHPLLTL